MASFSLTEKLAVTGAFLVMVALVVGTEDDPGLVVTGQESVKELRPTAPPFPVATVPPPVESIAEAPSPQPSPEPPVIDTPTRKTTPTSPPSVPSTTSTPAVPVAPGRDVDG